MKILTSSTSTLGNTNSLLPVVVTGNSSGTSTTDLTAMLEMASSILNQHTLRSTLELNNSTVEMLTSGDLHQLINVLLTTSMVARETLLLLETSLTQSDQLDSEP